VNSLQLHVSTLRLLLRKSQPFAYISSLPVLRSQPQRTWGIHAESARVFFCLQAVFPQSPTSHTLNVSRPDAQMTHMKKKISKSHDISRVKEE